MKTIDVTDLKSEQIAQIQAMLAKFKAKNYLENTIKNPDKSPINDLDISDIFFESEIIQPFNRSMLYGKLA